MLLKGSCRTFQSWRTPRSDPNHTTTGHEVMYVTNDKEIILFIPSLVSYMSRYHRNHNEIVNTNLRCCSREFINP